MRALRRLVDDLKRVVEVLGGDVEVAGPQAEIDAGGAAFDGQHRRPGHGRRQRLRPAHAAEAGGEDPAARKVAAVVLAARLDEGLVGALHDALRADVDPGARGHLAVHHQALAIELVEMVPGRPVRHEIRVGDEDARRVGMGAKDADGLARLDKQRLVRSETAERRDDRVEGLPVARRPADAAIDDELVRPLGDVGIEVVHQHPQRRFGQPALCADLGPARRADDPHVVETGGDGHGRFLFTHSKPACAPSPRGRGEGWDEGRGERVRRPAATPLTLPSPRIGCRRARLSTGYAGRG